MDGYVISTSYVFISASHTYPKHVNILGGINEYKKLLRRWIFVMAFFELPFPSQGMKHPYYIRYKLWIQLEFLVYRLTPQNGYIHSHPGFQR